MVLMEPGHTYSDKDMLCALVTWSDWDLEVCLSHECSRKQIRKPVFFSQWINIRAVYKVRASGQGVSDIRTMCKVNT